MPDLVRAEALGVAFPVGRWPWRKTLRAVRGVDLAIPAGGSLGLVGESGCGKTTLARLLAGLERPTEGHVLFDGRPLAPSGVAWRRQRRDIQIVWQNPGASLNPRQTVLSQVAEMLAIHAPDLAPAGRRDRARETLEKVGLGADLSERFPHQLSGGQRQRAVLARALAIAPRLVLFDEPISALDVSVQAQMIQLIDTLRQAEPFSYLFVTHDLRVAHLLSDRIAVMYLGAIVEIGVTAQIYAAPRHPYTQALLAAVPPLAARRGKGLVAPVTGEPPDPLAAPAGCAFHPRCPLAEPRCRDEAPTLRPLGSDHAAACHLAERAP